MQEVWKDIKGYEGLYQVSSHGRVKSLGNDKNRKEKILKGIYNLGYKQVWLSKNGIEKRYLVHRLVASHFIPNPDNKPQINHINCIRDDNRISNLEWCTQAENNRHELTRINKSESLKGRYVPKGKANCFSKKVVQFNTNGQFIKLWYCLSDIQRETNIKQPNITTCCQGKKETAGGYKWKYVSDIGMLGNLPILGRLTA